MPAKSQIKSRSTAKREAPPTAKAAGRKPAKTGYINARVEPKLKKSAEAVFDKIGLSTTDAVTIFLKQVVAQKGMPFAVNVPNRETIKAMRELDEVAARGTPGMSLRFSRNCSGHAPSSREPPSLEQGPCDPFDSPRLSNVTCGGSIDGATPSQGWTGSSNFWWQAKFYRR